MTGSHYRVLLVEDTKTDGEIVRQLLARAGGTFDIDQVMCVRDARAHLCEFPCDVILADLGLPDSDGAETVDALHLCAPNVPIVVLTSTSASEVAIEALNRGAQDYICKTSLETECLERAIRYAIERSKIRCENKRLLSLHSAHTEALRQKNEQLTRLVRTAQTFVDNVSHEFRTPLTVIREYTSLLREGVLGELEDEQCEFLDIVSDRADDLNNMVNDMLDSSRVRAGILRLDRTAASIAELMGRVEIGLKRKAEVRNVSLTVDLDDDLPDVFCDAEKVGRVITNLTVNAIKFCEEPGEVCISAVHTPASNEVVICVRDNGPGMGTEELAVIFERFRQLGTNTRSSTKGFGLGLNIVRELVDLNFGNLTVVSTPGKGSAFSFTVPVNHPVEIVGRYLDRLARDLHPPRSISLLSSRIEAPISNREMSGFWSYVQRGTDLVLPYEDQWFLVVACDEEEVNGFVERVDRERVELNRNRPQGPLPELNLTVHGSWPLNDGALAVMDCVGAVRDEGLRIDRRPQLSGPQFVNRSARQVAEELGLGGEG